MFCQFGVKRQTLASGSDSHRPVLAGFCLQISDHYRFNHVGVLAYWHIGVMVKRLISFATLHFSSTPLQPGSGNVLIF
jgi:hypothetical protein